MLLVFSFASICDGWMVFSQIAQLTDEGVLCDGVLGNDGVLGDGSSRRVKFVSYARFNH